MNHITRLPNTQHPKSPVKGSMREGVKPVAWKHMCDDRFSYILLHFLWTLSGESIFQVILLDLNWFACCWFLSSLPQIKGEEEPSDSIAKGANRMFRYSIFLLNIYSNKMPRTLIVENVKMELDLRGSLFVKRMINWSSPFSRRTRCSEMGCYQSSVIEEFFV